MYMIRKLSLILLALVILLSLLPVYAFASNSEALDFIAMTESAEGDGWSWDADSRTLTLDGVQMHVETPAARTAFYAIKLPANTTILLAEGTTNCISTGNSSQSISTILVQGSLKITGSGKLEVVAGDSNGGDSFGIYSNTSNSTISISGGADVYASSGSSKRSPSYSSAGIFTNGSISIENSAVTAKSLSGESTRNSYGIRASGTISILNSTVTASSDSVITDIAFAPHSAGIISDGKSGGVVISNSTVTAIGSTAELSMGIESSGTVSISGGSVKAIGVVSNSKSCGISADAPIEISDGAQIYAEGGNVESDGYPFSVGINSDSGSIDISGKGTVVTALGGDVSSDYADTVVTSGLSGLEGVSIRGGSVTACSGAVTAPAESFVASGAISSDGDITITGGDVNAIADGNTGTFSVSGAFLNYAPGRFYVSGGSFNASVAKYVDEKLCFEVKNSDGRFYYCESLDAAAGIAGNGAVINDISSGASLGNCTVKVIYGKGYEDFVQSRPIGSEFVLPDAPSKSGSVFMGWSCGGGICAAGETVILEGDISFTAVWARHPDTPYEPDKDETVTEPPSLPFYDVVESAWYYSSVCYVYGAGLMDGVETHVFAPGETLTRAMAWTILARLEGVETSGGDRWYSEAQSWASETGVSDGENPMAAVSREQLCTMLYRLAGEPKVSGSLSAFPDAALVSPWAEGAMIWAVSSGLVEGDENGALNPTAAVARAEAAALLMRFCGL